MINRNHVHFEHPITFKNTYTSQIHPHVECACIIRKTGT